MSASVPQGPEGGVLDRLARSISQGAGASAVFGAPVERDGVSVIPVALSRFAFGGGGGRGPTPNGRGEGEGGGGAAAARPCGFIEIRRGRARFRRIWDPLSVGVAALVVVAAASLLARCIRRHGKGLCGSCGRDRVPTPGADEREGTPGAEGG